MPKLLCRSEQRKWRCQNHRERFRWFSRTGNRFKTHLVDKSMRAICNADVCGWVYSACPFRALYSGDNRARLQKNIQYETSSSPTQDKKPCTKWLISETPQHLNETRKHQININTQHRQRAKALQGQSCTIKLISARIISHFLISHQTDIFLQFEVFCASLSLGSLALHHSTPLNELLKTQS